jgi:hypothetical protein
VELSLPAEPADTDPEGANNTGGDDGKSADGKDPEGQKPGGGDNPPDDSTRFDKHPRFVELNNRMKAAEDQNRQLLDRIDQLTRLQEQPKDKELPFKDVSKMSDEELLDWQSEDPKGFLDNINKMVAHQIETGMQQAMAQSGEQAQQREFETRVERTYQQYAEANPDFDPMWDSGEIQRFMDANPGHNAISAHQALTQEKRMQTVVDEAVKKALADADTARRSTRKAGAILGQGPGRGSTPPDSDAELKSPKQFGGATAVLAARLARRRAQAGR